MRLGKPSLAEHTAVVQTLRGLLRQRIALRPGGWVRPQKRPGLAPGEQGGRTRTALAPAYHADIAQQPVDLEGRYCTQRSRSTITCRPVASTPGCVVRYLADGIDDDVTPDRGVWSRLLSPPVSGLHVGTDKPARRSHLRGAPAIAACIAFAIWTAVPVSLIAARHQARAKRGCCSSGDTAPGVIELDGLRTTLAGVRLFVRQPPSTEC